MSYSLIIPIYNEENTLRELIKSVKKLNTNIEVVIVNDGSTDKTKSILSNQKKPIKIINKTINQGKGAAIITGFEHSSKETIILMDADLEISVAEIPKLIEVYETTKPDVLIGTRWEDIKFNLDLHYLGNIFINLLFNFLNNSNYKDILCCLKVMESKIFKSLNIKSQGFDIESEIMSKITTKNIKIVEQTINYKRRSKAEGKKLNFFDSFIIIWTIIRLKFFNYKANSIRI